MDESYTLPSPDYILRKKARRPEETDLPYATIKCTVEILGVLWKFHRLKSQRLYSILKVESVELQIVITQGRNKNCIAGEAITQLFW